MSWRISVIEDDRSRTVLPNVSGVGACVISSSRGKTIPVKFDKGQEQRIIDLLGYPSSTYPAVWEVIEYNKDSPIWVSAPNKSGKYGYILVTKTGSKAMTVGLTDPTAIDFENISYKQTVGTGDGITLTFTDTLELLPYVNQSISITLDGVELAVFAASDAATEILTATPLNAAGTNTLVRATGELSLEWTVAPLEGEIIEAVFDSDQSSLAYFALFQSSPQSDGDYGVLVTRDSNTELFNVSLRSKNIKAVWKEIASYNVSEISTKFDGFGQNVFVENIFNTDHDYIYAEVNSDLDMDTFSDDSSRVNFGGGSRGDAITLTEYTAGLVYFQDKNTYPADIFMDFSADAGIPALFATMRTTYQPYKSYLLPLPLAEDVTAAIITKAGYSINNRGLSFYWNWGKVRDKYGGTSGFYSSLIGKVGVKYAQMRDTYNGLAPSWVDENSHGGQLGSGIIELKWDSTETQLQSLDSAGINPIIFDNVYGVTVVSQRTAQSIGIISDSSWVGHSRVFDYIITNTLSQVLTFQITKLNDETHRQMATSLGQAILDPIISAGILAEAVVKCDSENNDSSVLSQRKFVYQIFLKVTPFSEYIEFIFTNVGQSVDIQELV